jgi:hypothetical protein
MSAGSGASNLGYGKIAPLSNINGGYVNVDSSNWPGRFGSNEISGSPPGIFPQGLAGAKSNIDAAAGIVPGICVYKGGSKKLKRKIKNITKQYKKMKMGSRKMRSMKRRLMNKYRSRSMSRKVSRGFAGGRKSSRKSSRAFAGGTHIVANASRQLGGYAQYQNNLPMTPVYKVAGVNLPASQLGLANPPPVTPLSNCVNCTDNYNHYTNKGFPSRGH